MEKTILGIASALKLDAPAFVATLKDSDGKWIADDEMAEKFEAIIQERFAAARTTNKKAFQGEYNTLLQKFVKGRGFDNVDNLSGKELLEAYAAWADESQPAGADGRKAAEMTLDELAKTPVGKQLIAKSKEEAGKAYQQLQGEYESAKKKWTTERVSDVAKRRMLEHLEEAKVMLEVQGSTVSRAKRVEAISSLLNFSELGLNEKGEPVFVDADGNPKTDEFGKPIDFKKHVVGLGSELYGIVKQDPNKGGANPPQSGPGGAAGQGTGHVRKYFPDTPEKYEEMRRTLPTTEYAQLRTDWNLQQQEMAAGK